MRLSEAVTMVILNHDGKDVVIPEWKGASMKQTLFTGSEKYLGDSQEKQGYESHPVVRESRYQLNYHKLNKKFFSTPKEKG